MRADFTTYAALLDSWAHRSATSDGRASERTPVPFQGEPVAVGWAAPPARDVAETLTDRHSSLGYDLMPVDTGPVLTFAQQALVRDQESWSDGVGPSEVFVFAMRPLDMPPGIYRVTVQGVARMADLPDADELDGFGLQREFGRAGGIVSAAADLDRADSWRGGHGYRIAMLRSSAVVYDIHLRSQAIGLVGTVFAGFIPGVVRRTLRSDGVGRQQMLAATYAAPLRPQPTPITRTARSVRGGETHE